MAVRSRIERLESRARSEGGCTACPPIAILDWHEGETEPALQACARCGGRDGIRAIVIHHPEAVRKDLEPVLPIEGGGSA